uniref:Secreted protein n=1 Tax=Acrobeloides nanus TaxID=290746 RepID=A0A914C3J1_9BILA
MLIHRNVALILLTLELLLSSTLCSSSLPLFAANLMFLIILCSSIHEIGKRELVDLKLDWLENRYKVAFSRELIIYS